MSMSLTGRDTSLVQAKDASTEYKGERIYLLSPALDLRCGRYVEATQSNERPECKDCMIQHKTSTELRYLHGS